MNYYRITLITTGSIFISQGLHNLIMRSPFLIAEIRKYLCYHKKRHWKLQHSLTVEANHHALQSGGQIITCYNLEDDLRVAHQLIIITEACRSFTTLLLSNEY